MTRRGLRLGLAAVVGLGVGGCATGPRLPDERRQEPYASLVRASEALPHEALRFAVRVPGGRPVEVALDVTRTPRGASRPVLVFQSGLLSDGSTWRFLVGALGGAVDTIAVDPPGTGASDAPDPQRAGPASYTPGWLAEHTLLALESWERTQPAPRRYVLVGHSLGGTAVLRMLADPDLAARHGPWLGRVEGAVLLDPADLAMERADPKLLAVADVSDLEAGLGSWLGVLRKKVVEGVVTSVPDRCRDALAQEAERIATTLGRSDQRHAAQAMLRRFRGPGGACGGDLALARRLAEQERGIRVPVRILWGQHDDTLSSEQGVAIAARVPRAQLSIVAGTKHSMHQDRAAETAAEILRFLEHGLAAPPAVAR